MCGRCHACVIDREPSLCENRRRYMTESANSYPCLHGGFSKYGYVYPTAGRVRVPEDVPDALASAAACSLRTVMRGFERLGRVAATDTVRVQGAGPVGLFKYRHLVRGLGVKPRIARRGTEHGSGLGTQRWVVERTFAHLHWFRRLRIRWEIRDDIHEAFLSLGCSLICWRKLCSLR